MKLQKTYICKVFFIINSYISLMSRLFTIGSGDRGSISG